MCYSNWEIDNQHSVSEMNVRMNRRRIFRQKPNGSTENLCLDVLYHLTQSRTSKAVKNYLQSGCFRYFSRGKMPFGRTGSSAPVHSLLSGSIRRNSTSAASNLAHTLELEMKQSVREKFIMLLEVIEKGESVEG